MSNIALKVYRSQVLESMAAYFLDCQKLPVLGGLKNENWTR